MHALIGTSLFPAFANGAPLFYQIFPYIFVFAFGASVGSFVNVVVYRMPAGMSLTTPPSRCPICGARLRFLLENTPILGWLLLRGRCRFCKAKIPIIYWLMEVGVGLMFVGLYAILYAVPGDFYWLGGIGNRWWQVYQFGVTFPAYFSLAFLLAGLLAMTLIDAKTFTIPIEIPVFVTCWAFVFAIAQSFMPTHRALLNPNWPVPGVSWPVIIACFGGFLGMAISWALLKLGVFRMSFHDYESFRKDGDVALVDYPHARREMGIELIYLAPVLLLAAAGWWLGSMHADVAPSRFWQSIGGTAAGYFSGAALIWGIRILGTLGFGREAMGLGDVHLLGAVGAVLGWFEPILIFFVAPFSGILWAVASILLARVFRGLRREMPYGPHLAVATILVVMGRPLISSAWQTYFHAIPMPQPGLYEIDYPDEAMPKPAGLPEVGPRRRGSIE